MNHTPQTWIPHLDQATGALSTPTATTTEVYQALALTWHTSEAITQPASVHTEWGWLRLVETLHTAWTELAAVATPPTAAPFQAGTPPITGPLADTRQVRDAVTGLVHATAAALRTLQPSTVDAALTTTGIAAELDTCVEDWP